MANHKQAEKRNRQTIKRTARNRVVRSTMRTYVKRVRAFISEGKAAEARETLKLAIRQLDKAAGKGVIHKNTASRSISRLIASVAKMPS